MYTYIYILSRRKFTNSQLRISFLTDERGNGRCKCLKDFLHSWLFLSRLVTKSSDLRFLRVNIIHENFFLRFPPFKKHV